MNSDMNCRQPTSRVAFRHRLGTRMLLWTVGVTGLILTAVIVWHYVSVLGRLESDARDRAVFIAKGSADRIDATLGMIEGIVQGVALTMEVEKFDLSYDHIQRLQAQTLGQHPEIHGMAIALIPEMKPSDWPVSASYAYRIGERVGYETLTAAKQAYLRDDWFIVPQYMEKPNWSEPYLKITGTKMVTYSVPVFFRTGPPKTFAGVVACDIDLGWLDQAIFALPLGKQGYGLLMTRIGTYVSHPILDLVLNESVFSIAEAQNDTDLRRVGQQLVSGASGIVPWVSWAWKQECWLAWQPLETADWTMVTVVSKAELKAEILRFSRNSALLGVCGLAVLILAVGFVARSVTRPVHDLSVAAGTLFADLDAPLPMPKGRDEVARLSVTFSAMRDNLKRYIADLAETTAVRERMNAELQVAHDIQMDLLPKTFPAFPDRGDMDLFAIMEPAREVGGDFYDFFMLDDDRLVIAIADVSGKGVPAALFMAVTRSFLRSAFKVASDPGNVLSRVNEELSDGNDSCMFVTLFCAVVRLSDGAVAYANAGHNPPAMTQGGGQIAWISAPFGPAAGAIPGVVYETGHVMLPAGETLLLYTDGVTEAMDHENRQFGTDRLAIQLKNSSGRTCRQSLAALLSDIRSHAQGAEQSDDITMLMFKRLLAETSAGGDASILERRISLANTLTEIPRLAQEIEAFGQAGALTGQEIYQLNLVLEELVANTISYGYTDSLAHAIDISLRLGADRLTVVLTDDGVAFNPLADAPAPVLTGDVEDRPIGGLGIHLMRTLMDEISYEREGGKNRLAMTRRLQTAGASVDT